MSILQNSVLAALVNMLENESDLRPGCLMGLYENGECHINADYYRLSTSFYCLILMFPEFFGMMSMRMGMSL